MSLLSEFIEEFDYMSRPPIENVYGIVWQEKMRSSRLQLIKNLTASSKRSLTSSKLSDTLITSN